MQKNRSRTIEQSSEGHLRPSGGALWLVFYIMLMDVIGMSILIPVAPYLVIRYGGDALTVTLLSVTYATAQFFAAPVLGRLGDRYGRRPVLLLSVLGSAFGYLIFGLGGALWLFFLSRLIDGVTGGNMSTASAYIADVSTPETRSANFRLVGMAWGVGLVLGPTLGAVFGQISLKAPAFVAAALSLTSVVLSFFFLPESLAKDQRQTNPIRIGDLNAFVLIQQIASLSGVGRLLLVLCVFNFAFNGINSTEAIFMIQRFAASPWQVGLQMSLVGLAVTVTYAVAVPWVTRRYREKSIAITCLWGQALCGVATFFAFRFWLFSSISAFSHAVSGLIFPTLTALISHRVSPGKQGALMGVIAALNSMMSILGPLWAGLAYSHVMLGSPYWMGALVYALAALALATSPAHEQAA